VLLDRDRELAALDAPLDGGVVVVEGAGIGKTSLVEEGYERARRRGWRVLRGCGSELETGFAFGWSVSCSSASWPRRVRRSVPSCWPGRS